MMFTRQDLHKDHNRQDRRDEPQPLYIYAPDPLPLAPKPKEKEEKTERGIWIVDI